MIKDGDIYDNFLIIKKFNNGKAIVQRSNKIFVYRNIITELDVYDNDHPSILYYGSVKGFYCFSPSEGKYSLKFQGNAGKIEIKEISSTHITYIDSHNKPNSIELNSELDLSYLSSSDFMALNINPPRFHKEIEFYQFNKNDWITRDFNKEEYAINYNIEIMYRGNYLKIKRGCKIANLRINSKICEINNIKNYQKILFKAEPIMIIDCYDFKNITIPIHLISSLNDIKNSKSNDKSNSVFVVGQA